METNYLNPHNIDPGRVEPAHIDAPPGFDSIRPGQNKAPRSRELCNILSDIVSVSDRPVIVNGEIYKQRGGNVYLHEEARDAILEAMAYLHCRNVGFGTYDCYDATKYGFDVDSCLVGEINRLNNQGIKTIGCCCGHGRRGGYIQVTPTDVDKMLEMGYEEEGERWCFKPRTSIPPARDTNHLVDINNMGGEISPEATE